MGQGDARASDGSASGPRVATPAGIGKFTRRALFVLGCIVLAILTWRLLGPAPKLEMTADSCSDFDAQATPFAKLREHLALAIAGRDDRLGRDWAQLCQYRMANAAVRAGPPVRVVMIGDSITEFWRTENPELFGEGVVNRGIAGQTSAQILVRFQQDAVALRPGIVHIMAGLNDIAGNTGRISPEDYQNNIAAMIDMARANGMTVVLGSITPARNFFWRKGIDPSRRIVELNRWLAETARARGLIYADYHSVLADRNGYFKAEYDADGSHPTGAGFDAMKPVLEAALAEAARTVSPASAAAAPAGGGS